NLCRQLSADRRRAAMGSRTWRVGQVKPPQFAQSPDPQGGGISFVVITQAFLCFLYWRYPEQRPVWLALAGGLPVAASRCEISARFTSTGATLPSLAFSLGNWALRSSLRTCSG